MMQQGEWTSVISANKSLIRFNLKEILQYKHLLKMFVWRDIVAEYKQTILGPIWFFIQPIFTTLIYFIVFRKLANISTDQTPPILFYLIGIIFWNYFADVFTKTSNTFLHNQQLFGKVYFPRLIKPLSVVISNLLKFVIQFCLFLLIYIYYSLTTHQLYFNSHIILFPIILLTMACLGLGLGLIFTSLTIKYRDLSYLLQFGIQLFMFATPIIYPLSQVPNKYAKFIYLNPLAHLIEALKLGLLNKGFFDIPYFLLSIVCSIIILIIGIIIFNKTEYDFTDVI